MVRTLRFKLDGSNKARLWLAIFLLLLPLLFLHVLVSVLAADDLWLPFVVTDEDPIGIPAVYQNQVAWREHDIGFPLYVRIKDLTTSEIRDLDEVFPCPVDFVDLYGDWVVTEQVCILEPWKIHAFNLVSGELVEVTPADVLKNNHMPAVHEDKIVWIQVPNASSSDVLLFDLITGTTISITNDGGTNFEYWPDIAGDWVVWVSGVDHDIYAYNLVTSETVTITQDPYGQWLPRIDSELVVWEETRNGNSDIYAFDLNTRQEIPIATGPGSQIGGGTHNRLVTWIDYQSEDDRSVRGYDLKTGESLLIYQYPSDSSYLESPTIAYGDLVVWNFSLTLGDTILYGARRLRNEVYLPIIHR